MIRPTRKEDIPEVLALIHQFQKESLDEYLLFCDDDKAVKLMESVWQNALILEVEGKVVGVIAGMIGSSMVSTDPVMQELIWFIHPSHRGQGTAMLTAFENMAKERGCKHLLMVFMGNVHRKAMERLYTRSGYAFLEAQFIKCLQ